MKKYMKDKTNEEGELSNGGKMEFVKFQGTSTLKEVLQDFGPLFEYPRIYIMSTE